MEFKLELLRWVEVIEDDKAVGGLVVGDLAEVDALSREGRHGAVIVQMGAAQGQVFVELHLVWPLLHQVVAGTTEPQRVRLGRRSLNIANLNGQVQHVVLGFERAEQGEYVADLIGLESSLGVLDLEHPEVVVLSVELLETGHVDLILELGDAEIFDLDGVRDGPFKADWNGRQIISVLNKLELCTPVERLTFEFDTEGLTVQNLEEDAEVVLADLLGVVEYMQVHLFTWR